MIRFIRNAYHGALSEFYRKKAEAVRDVNFELSISYSCASTLHAQAVW